jgi:hypothetical protein
VHHNFCTFVENKKTIKTIEELLMEAIESKIIFKDYQFLLFIGFSFCLSLMFFQLFTTLPLCHNDFLK